VGRVKKKRGRKGGGTQGYGEGGRVIRGAEGSSKSKPTTKGVKEERHRLGKKSNRKKTAK